MEKNKEYWKKRIDETAQNRFDLTYEVMQSETRQIYDKIAREIEKEVEGMYYKLLDESLSRTEIWTYKHYRDLANSLNMKMVKLGLKEIDILNYNLEEALRGIYVETPLPNNTPVKPSFSLIDDVQVQQIIARPWSEKHFKSTEWDNKQELVKILKKGITDSIVKGESKDKLVKAVMDKMEVGFNMADRVVRTELMATINLGQIQRYKDNGYKKLEIVTTNDCRRCEYCASRDGDIVDIDSTDIPPWHPRDRCTIMPVLDSAEEIIQKTDKKPIANKRGEEIKFDLDGMKDNDKQRIIKTITKLSEQYNTELRQVIKGGGNEAGSVNIGFVMKLNNSQIKNIYHEFAHTLTITDADKYKLTDNKLFWKEIRKIRKEYTADVSNNPSLSISSYASANVDEFMAEAFTQAKLIGSGELDIWYGSDTTYSNKVLTVIDKYFKK